MKSMLSETDEDGRPVVCSRVAGVVVTSNEDRALGVPGWPVVADGFADHAGTDVEVDGPAVLHQLSGTVSDQPRPRPISPDP